MVMVITTGMGMRIPTEGTPSPQAALSKRLPPKAATPLAKDVDADLRHHADAEVRDTDLVDLAVNVRWGTPPPWLRRRLTRALGDLSSYPDARAAREAVAERHGRPENEVLLTSGAAEAFVLLARTLAPRRAVVVHPQFTEPEAALLGAGHLVHRVLLSPEAGFGLPSSAVSKDADLVVLGNPTNPTSVLHHAATVKALARRGRTLVVDEAFMDTVPGETHSLSSRRDVPGLVVVRSLTKTWGLAGLRVGYLLAEPRMVAALERAQPLWPVSTPALAAVEACCSPRALAEAQNAAHQVARDRAHLLDRLAKVEGVETFGTAAASFVLVRVPEGGAVRDRLRRRGFAVRRGDTFPGLGPDWLRIAVRDQETSDRLAAALSAALDDRPDVRGAAWR